MPNTYTELRQTTVGTATPSVTFNLSGISGYTDLVLVANIKHSFGTTGDVSVDGLQFNSDTGGNYSFTRINGNGTTAVSDRGSNMTGISYVATRGSETSFATNIINIQNYSNTNTFKTVLLRGSGNGTSVGTNAQVGLWRNTAAITSITINATSTFNILAGSTFSLYGIAAAPVLTAKATGGTIYYGSDGYVYHRFTGSGSFVPSSNLSADCLVVAGGGGGGAGAIGGGGGAGGLRGLFSQSLASGTTYSVAVGGGGTAGVWEFTKGGTGGPSSISGTGLTTITSAGGGGGGSGDQATAGSGNSGGSGGGANYQATTTGGTGNTPATTPSQGNDGRGYISGSNGGGGGGAGAAATSQNAGAGSSAYSVWGSATSSGQSVSGTFWYAGGGGGGGRNGTTLAGTGGNGGGGAGSLVSTGTPGTANTGGGGGGTGWVANNTAGGSAGGSGIVIIRYLG